MHELAHSDTKSETSNPENESETENLSGEPGLKQYLPNFEEPRGRNNKINPENLTPNKMLALQRTIGNKAVNRLLAARVKKQPAAGPNKPPQPTVQRVPKPKSGLPKSIVQRLVSTDLKLKDPVIISQSQIKGSVLTV